MLSICIPVYNYDGRPPVRELLRQAWEANLVVEILLYDNAAGFEHQKANAELTAYPEVRYHRMTRHLSRARIRNKMAREASFDRLIMMDVDGYPNANFLTRYLSAPPYAVVSGGRVYAPEPPSDPSLLLHWKYGRRRASIAPARRRQSPYYGFQSNNFMVARELLLDHPLPDITGYGHEDTLWGQLLAPHGIGITYIDNPVTHLGLEEELVFVQRQRQAVRSLRELQHRHPTLRTRLTEFADSYPGTARLARHLPEKMLVRWLFKTHNLRLLDLLKLQWWTKNRPPAIGYSRNRSARPKSDARI